MCNLERLEKNWAEIAALFSKTYSEVVTWPEGWPNVHGDIKITDRGRRGAGGLEVVSRRWSWPSPNGKPVFNYVSEGRRFPSGRCLIICDGFYEFTAPPEGSPKSAKKTKWLFTMPGQEVFGIAGIFRPWQDSEAWTMLTTAPGPDVAPYHNRQIIPLSLQEGMRWIDGAPEAEILRAGPAGSLAVCQTA